MTSRIYEGRSVLGTAANPLRAVKIWEFEKGVTIVVQGFEAYLTADEAATLANQLRALVRRCRKAQEQ